LPPFMNFTGTGIIIQPMNNQEAGVYPIDISLTDGYSPPKFYNFLVTVYARPPKPAHVAQA